MADMTLNPGKIERHCAEPEVYNSLLQLDGCRLLELGCGKAELTRAIASDPSYADAYFNLADLYEQLGKQAMAIQNLKIYRTLTRG